MFRDALSYPVRSGGWVMLLIGAVFSVIVDFLQMFPLVGLVVAVFGAGFFAGFYLDVVGSTVIGRDAVPDWPEVTEVVDDILLPLLRVIGLVLISFAPAGGVLFAGQERVGDWFWWIFGGAVAAGVAYFPMAVLGSVAYGNLFGALPHVVLPAIVRTLPGYALAVSGLTLAVAVTTTAEKFGASIPFVGWFVAAVVALYALMMQARLIGLIHREKAEELGWL